MAELRTASEEKVKTRNVHVCTRKGFRPIVLIAIVWCMLPSTSHDPSTDFCESKVEDTMEFVIDLLAPFASWKNCKRLFILGSVTANAKLFYDKSKEFGDSVSARLHAPTFQD